MHTGFAKIPRGGQGFQEKVPRVSPYFGFYYIFMNKCFEICLRGVLYLPSPLPHLYVCFSCVCPGINLKTRINNARLINQRRVKGRKCLAQDKAQRRQSLFITSEGSNLTSPLTITVTSLQ
jgi:hypothetical protein